MSDGFYANKLIEFIDDEFMRYVHETYEKIIEKVEEAKASKKKNANGSITIGFYAYDLQFTINKNVALDFGYRAAGIDDLGTLTSALSKRYSLFHFDFSDVNEFTFKFFGFFGFKTNTCKLFIEELKKLLKPCGIDITSFFQHRAVTDAKISYRCDLSRYKAPVKSNDLQQQVKTRLKELLDDYNLMCMFDEESTDPIVCYSYLSSEKLNRNILLKYTIHTQPIENRREFIAIFGLNLGKIVDRAKAESFENERNARIDKNEDFSIITKHDFYLMKPLLYTNVDELMGKLEDVLAEGAHLLGTEEGLLYTTVTEKTWG